MSEHRTITKNKACVEDLALGRGDVIQRRAGNAYTLQRLPVHLNYDVLADAVAQDLPVGISFTLNGLHAAGDGHLEDYRVVNADTFDGVPDGVHQIELANGNLAILQERFGLSTLQFDADNTILDVNAIGYFYTITGGSGNRINCGLSDVNTHEGMTIQIEGHTASVDLTDSPVMDMGGGITIGGSTGNLTGATLMFANGKWRIIAVGVQR